MIFRRITLPSPVTPGKPVRLFELDLVKTLDNLINNLSAIFDRGVNIDDNIDAKRITITTSATPDLEVAYSHELKRVPIGYIVIERDKAGVIYDGTSSWTDTTIYLRSNVASVAATILVF